MIFDEKASLEQKLQILSDAAKYDVACTSSGVERKGKKGDLGNSCASGICHSFAADGRCISLLKILFTNECIYNCKYCINRVSNDVPRATFTPDEVCRLTVEFYRRNYIEGLFLSSGVIESPDETMERLYLTLRKLRREYHFQGYVHCKAVPGASQELVELAGWYADRMSVNLELPTAEGLRELAPNKSRKTILTPMRQIQCGIDESRQLLGNRGGNRSAYWYTCKRMGRNTPEIGSRYEKTAIPGGSTSSKTQKYSAQNGQKVFSGVLDNVCVEKLQKRECTGEQKEAVQIEEKGFREQKKSLDHGVTGNLFGEKEHMPERKPMAPKGHVLTQWRAADTSRGFVPGGQSTQMIIGATRESDYEILTVSEALYQKFDLKRVFYSAFVNVNQDLALGPVGGKPPLLREHRLYQADFLLRYYGFQAGELLSPDRPFFNEFLDPKCFWALGHMEEFPVEVNQADYNTLLRVPGIGAKSAGRIMQARKTGKLDFCHLKKMGIVLKRAAYFITCNGKMLHSYLKVDAAFITRQLVGNEKEVQRQYEFQNMGFEQLSLFSDFHIQTGG